MQSRAIPLKSFFRPSENPAFHTPTVSRSSQMTAPTPPESACGGAASHGYWRRNQEALVKFEKPEKIDAALFKEMFLECLALFGVIALAGTLAIAFRLFEGKW